MTIDFENILTIAANRASTAFCAKQPQARRIALIGMFVVLASFSNSDGATRTKNSKPTGSPVTIQLQEKAQIIEGWGGSLCWWANIMGGYSDEKIQQICHWITDPVNGLNMNIFRFNIGGGDHPAHHHMRTDGGDMPGYKASATAPYDWSQDANQRKILSRLIAARIANTGKNDVKIIGFSNSPPWWMTVSGCVAGSVTGKTTNLRPDMFDDFADYLTEVTRHYHDSLGITFDHLEPFNEPFSDWWVANKEHGQEGCHFAQEDQHTMIRQLHDALSQKKMLSYCKISAMDANTLDEGYKGALGYKAAGEILPKLDRLDIHSYGGTKRAELAAFAKVNHIKLWQSESGPLAVGGDEEFQLMTVCDRIITDLKEMQCTAWIDWQLAADNSPTWGLIVGKYADPSRPIRQAISFYLRAQFSRYLKGGYTLINTTTPHSIGALSPDGKELIVVVSHKPKATQRYIVNLSGYSVGDDAQQIVTRANHSLRVKTASTPLAINGTTFTYDAPGESVTTFVIKVK